MNDGGDDEKAHYGSNNLTAVVHAVALLFEEGRDMEWNGMEWKKNGLFCPVGPRMREWTGEKGEKGGERSVAVS